MYDKFFMRIFFKAYFPSDSYNHLHQTTNELLNKVFSTESFKFKLNRYLYIDQNIAN